MKKYEGIATILMRFALATGFLSAVGSRLSLWGSHSSGWASFLDYTKSVNSFVPVSLIPLLAIISTILETGFAILLLIGYKIRWAAIGCIRTHPIICPDDGLFVWTERAVGLFRIRIQLIGISSVYGDGLSFQYRSEDKKNSRLTKCYRKYICCEIIFIEFCNEIKQDSDGRNRSAYGASS